MRCNVEIEIIRFTICIQKELLEKFRYVAECNDQSVGSMLQLAIRREVSAFEQKNGEIWL